jgi:hypothetical protein
LLRQPGSLSEPLRTFTPAAKVWLAGEIASTYVQARWWLREPDVTQTVAMARRMNPNGISAQAPAQREAALLGIRLGIIIGRTFRLLPGDTRCLTRSIVLLRMLARRRIPASLIIGVRSAPTFGAHAWIEHAGQPLLEPIEDTGRRMLEL